VLKGPTNKLKKLKRDLEKCRRGPLTNENLVAQKELLLRIELLLEQEELVWVQCARLNWLKHGNRNTSFFQKFATSQKRRNPIKSQVDDQGVRHENLDVMKDMVKGYFENLFTAEVKPLVWFWLIDETLVLTSMLSVWIR
jgi:hypothetical protein